ncbi:MAG TPA: hypothetical protein VII56_05440 [Rhizomicrobium sp.]
MSGSSTTNPTGSIIITYAPGAQFTSTNSTIVVGGNGAFLLQNSAPLLFAGTITFAQLSISTVQIMISNTSSTTPVNGAITIPVTVKSGNVPTITATNFSGAVEVQWPTPNGQQTQTLSPSDTFYLNNFGS